MKKFIQPLISINPASLTFVTVLLVVIFFVIGIPILDLVELKTYDLRFLSRGHLDPSPKVVMAVIDEKSLDTEGRWPWPRAKIAHLLDTLNQEGAKVIGFDVGFLEPDENSYLTFINQLDLKIDSLQIRDRKLSNFIDQSRDEADNDLALARAIKNSKASIVLGYFFHLSKSALDYQIAQEEIDIQLQRIAPSKYPLTVYDTQGIEEVPFIDAYAPEANLEVFAEATRHAGFFNMLPDRDGVARWMPLIIQCKEDIFPPLSLECVRQYLDPVSYTHLRAHET